MQILDYFQNQHPNTDYFIHRKCQIPFTGDINLFGVRGSGKTTLNLRP